ncbi:hypothetical protein RND81_10G041900 [Saponaria officinalis]|uniref:C2H2-type domain-containing protein n=1 Tax=Saponaria officinalis TaxID=3572 RepID=A0AAW1HXW3_SAPOF
MILPLPIPPLIFFPQPTKIPICFLQIKPRKSLISFSPKCPQNVSPLQCQNNPNSQDIDMVQNKHGVYIPKQNKVVVLWDLDNKPPRGPPYEAAVSLKTAASRFGEVVEISAYANRHAFSHLPTWVVDERRERRRMDMLERKGVSVPSQPYICKVCGRKCKTNLDLKKHFKQLHERERQKKLSRMRQLKGKKRVKYKERYIEKGGKFEEAARELIKPRIGYGLDRELRRAGVFVKTVEDKPQAADWALKRQMMHSMTRGIDWLVLVSDDSDFREMIRKAREANLGTVVVGDRDRALGRYADLWVPWSGVEKGEVTDKDLVPKRRSVEDINWGDDDLFSISRFEEGVVGTGTGSVGRFSAFSEGEDDQEWEDEDEDDEFDDGSDYDELELEEE